jgi:hypothetical protein
LNIQQSSFHTTVHSEWKSGLLKEVTSHEGDNLIGFYNLIISQIWLDKRGGLWWEWPYKRETTILLSVFFVNWAVHRFNINLLDYHINRINIKAITICLTRIY